MPPLYGQVIFQLVADSPVKDLGEYFAEKACHNKHQNNDQYSRGQIEKKTEQIDQRDAEAVIPHAAQTSDIFSDKTVILQHAPEHAPEFPDDQYSTDAGKGKQQKKRPVKPGKMGIVFPEGPDRHRQGDNDQKSGIKHEV